jgi:hypothetical protein
VTFLDGTNVLGTGSVNGSGIATLITSALAIGTHNLSAAYGGDNNFRTSTSGPLSLSVNQATPTISLSLSPAPSSALQPVTLTAIVAAPSGNVNHPSGTVTFFDGGTALGTVNLDNSGTAALTTSSLAVGTHTLIAVYNGNTNFAGVTSSPDSQVVNPLTPTATLSAPGNTTAAWQPVTLKVIVAPPSGTSTVPTGTVSFFNNGTLIGSLALDGTGTATLTISTLGPGMHYLRAAYSGDALFAPVTSNYLVLMLS